MKGKFFLLLLLTELASFPAQADAGFSISRRRPTAHITFEGMANVGNGYTLVRVRYDYHDSDWRKENPQIGRLDTVNDQFRFAVQNGGRNWDESERNVRFNLVDAAGRVTDSFTLFMKKYDYHLVVSGVENGKLKYQLKKKKAVFEYGLVSYDEPESGYRITRWIFICSSLAGLLALVAMFMKKRKTQAA